MGKNGLTKIYWYSALVVGILLSTGILLWLMGRVLICECGYVKLWHGVTWSSENSQHLSDWYTFSHIIHGFIFYWLAKKIFPRWSTGARLIFALGIEAGWEILENSQYIINRYREGTISLDYYGDSIINSLADIVAMLIGFWMAAKLPVWVVVVAAVIIEVFVGYWIRDNLTLNIVMLLYPLEAIKQWQMAELE